MPRFGARCRRIVESELGLGPRRVHRLEGMALDARAVEIDDYEGQSLAFLGENNGEVCLCAVSHRQLRAAQLAILKRGTHRLLRQRTGLFGRRHRADQVATRDTRSSTSSSDRRRLPA